MVFIFKRIIIAGTIINEEILNTVEIGTSCASQPARSDPIVFPMGNIVWRRAIPTFASLFSTRSLMSAVSGATLKPQANP